MRLDAPWKKSRELELRGLLSGIPHSTSKPLTLRYSNVTAAAACHDGFLMCERVQPCSFEWAAAAGFMGCTMGSKASPQRARVVSDLTLTH